MPSTNAGFWLRFRALIIDVFMIIGPIDYVIIPLLFGWSALKNLDPTHPARIFEFILLTAITLIFWLKTGQTPGKKATGTKIVDALSGNDISVSQAVLRYVGYFFSIALLGFGFFLAGWRKDKRALHDLLAGTKVIILPEMQQSGITKEPKL